MTFLHSRPLKNAIRDLLGSTSEAKIAVAYWGKDALDLLPLRPDQSKVQILCCLKGGRSDPKVISKFKNRRQLDNLHAKVFWTPEGAIVGSSNASSNGLPEEEDSSDGLIEAGAFISDPKQLVAIKKWFDALYARANKINKADLAKAEAARKARLFNKGRSNRRAPIFATPSVDQEQFGLRKTFIYLYRWNSTTAEDNRVKDSIKGSADLPSKKISLYNWFVSETKPSSAIFPGDSILVTCRYKNGKADEFSVDRVLPNGAIRKTGTREWALLLLALKDKLQNGEKRAISAASRELWRVGKSDGAGNKIIALDAAAPILAKHIGIK